ncbi:T9SS type A sorting domain-containing protein [candidate division TA06 bacterium]|uniref:T9SS type A sorting domain-containing protein n=1 Tax=candidate division TA06 bacterium TaxID=2250710 RepID=A0A933MKJ2_UNCT6|nr:T9SS type A sorting domain-containing protein [candidate division TA06 bacterium]
MRMVLLILFACAAIHPLQAAQGGPDAFGYRWIDSDEPAGPVYSWTEIRGLGTSPGAADDKSWLVALPQSFRFYGQIYDSVYICTNGFASFTSPDSTPLCPDITLPNPVPPNAALAPFWNDMDLGAAEKGQLYFYNDASSRRFIMEWDSAIRWGGSNRYSFQLVLCYDDSSVAFNYRTAGPGWQTDNNTGIGIEDQAGGAGLQISQSLLKDNYAVKFCNPPDSHDVRAAAEQPDWYVEPGSPAACRLRATNAGLFEESFPVQCFVYHNAALIFSDTVAVNALAPGGSVSLTFDPWTAGTSGEQYVVKLCCAMDNDGNRANDTVSAVTVSFPYRNKLNCPWRTSPIAIDGVLSNGEWPDTVKIDVTDILGRNLQTPPAGSAFLYAVNDSSALYLAVDVPWDASLESGDALYLFVDDDGDGAWAGDNSEGRYILQWSGAADSLTFTTLPAVINSGTSGIARAVGIASGHAQYEMSIPFGGGTGSDIRNGPGGIAKIHLSWQDGADKNIYAWWPQDMELPQDEDPAHYGRLVLADASGVAEQLQGTVLSPGIFRLWNSPNPFAVQTRISYQLPASGQVELGIYNVAGQLVKTLIAGFQPPGKHSATWNSAGVFAAGVYFYRLKFNGREQIGKMLLIK